MSNENKKDGELKRQIKEMEAAQRSEALKSQPAQIAEPEASAPKISFDVWWMYICAKVSLKPWMREIIIADFKARGLKMEETEQKYDDTLRIFGYKW